MDENALNAPNVQAIRSAVQLALDEDLAHGDVTTSHPIPPRHSARATIVAHHRMTVAGLAVAREVFLTVDPSLRITKSFRMGTPFLRRLRSHRTGGCAIAADGGTGRRQFSAAAVRHRHAHRAILSRCSRLFDKDSRYAQNHAGTAGARKMGRASGRRQKPSLFTRRRRADQGQPSCRIGIVWCRCGGGLPSGSRHCTAWDAHRGGSQDVYRK